MARMRRWLAVLAGVAVLGPLMATSTPAEAAANLEGVPHFNHIFTIVLENENYSASWVQAASRPTSIR